MPSPSTRMHGPPYTTLSASPFSWMYLITLSSSAPGWSQSAGTDRAFACSRIPRVTYSFKCRTNQYHLHTDACANVSSTHLWRCDDTHGRLRRARQVRERVEGGYALELSLLLLKDRSHLWESQAERSYRVDGGHIFAARQVPLQHLGETRDIFEAR